jgi:hypothetical protein
MLDIKKIETTTTPISIIISTTITTITMTQNANNLAVQNDDFLTHKKAFSGILDFILLRCCVGACCNVGIEYVNGDDGYDEEGDDPRYCIMICDVCAPNDEEGQRDNIIDDMWENEKFEVYLWNNWFK